MTPLQELERRVVSKVPSSHEVWALVYALRCYRQVVRDYFLSETMIDTGGRERISGLVNDLEMMGEVEDTEEKSNVHGNRIQI